MLLAIVLQVVLVIFVFAISLNECLNGSGKALIRKVLFTTHLGLVVCSFLFWGLKWGLISIAVVIVCGIIFAPLSKVLASKILGRHVPDNLGVDI
jgi:hypothetical protein